MNICSDVSHEYLLDTLYEEIGLDKIIDYFIESKSQDEILASDVDFEKLASKFFFLDKEKKKIVPDIRTFEVSIFERQSATCHVVKAKNFKEAINIINEKLIGDEDVTLEIKEVPYKVDT